MRAKTLTIGALLGACVLAGCGTTPKPVAGTIAPTATTAGRGSVDDPRTPHLKCLRDNGVIAQPSGRTQIIVQGGPVVDFAPSAGAAAALQINGQAQGAEVIGQALLYPAAVSAAKLKIVENCLTNAHY